MDGLNRDCSVKDSRIRTEDRVSHLSRCLQKWARALPAPLVELPEKHARLFIVLRIATLLAAFLLVDFFLRRAGDLPSDSYARGSLLAGLIDRIGVATVLGLLGLAMILARYGGLLDPWSAFELGGRLRGFIVLLAFLMAWPFTTFEFNYFFDQGYYLERILLALLLPLIWARPVFIYPFLLIAFAILWQLGEPQLSSGAIFPHKLQVLHVLDLFAALLMLHAFTGSRRIDGFFFLTCRLIAGAYWVPGFAKLEMGWITHGHLYHMPLAAYAHGWLSFLEPTTIVAYAQAMAWFDWPMRIFVSIAEIGCLVFLWRRTVTFALLGAVTLFHIATFALYGYLFWTWIALDIAVLVVLARDRRERRIDIYSPTHFAASVVLIAFVSHWAQPASLAWFDTRLSYTYRYEVVGVSGERYRLPPRFFAPYGDVFTMANFSYLVRQHGLLVSPYGITGDRARADRLMEARTPSDIYSLESEIGLRRYDAERAQRFYDFIERYMTNWNARDRSGFNPAALRPPPQFWSFPRDDAFIGQENVREVIVKEVTSLYDNERLKVIRELELARIAIPAKSSNEITSPASERR